MTGDRAAEEGAQPRPGDGAGSPVVALLLAGRLGEGQGWEEGRSGEAGHEGKFSHVVKYLPGRT